MRLPRWKRLLTTIFLASTTVLVGGRMKNYFRSIIERTKFEREREFLLCSIVNCAFTVEKEKQFCYRHICHAPKCEQLVVAYTDGLAKYCPVHSTKQNE